MKEKLFTEDKIKLNLQSYSADVFAVSSADWKRCIDFLRAKSRMVGARKSQPIEAR